MPYGNGGNVRFKQEFNTYLWSFDFNTLNVIHNRWQFNMAEHFQSSLLNVSSNDDKWKDDQTFKLNLDYRLLNNLQINSQLASVVFLDRQSGFTNDIRTHTGNLGITYTPTPKIRAKLYLGPKWDKRYEQNDHGYNYSIQAGASDLEWDEYHNSLDFSLNHEDYDTRQNYDINAQYNMTREFATDTFDSLHIFTTNQRRDNYTSFTGDVESLREQVRGVDNALDYLISDHSKLTLRSGIYFKDVEILSFLNQNEEKRRKRNDQRLSQDVFLNQRFSRLTTRLQLSYWSQKQLYDIEVDNKGLPFSQRTAFITPDNESSRIMMVGGAGLGLTRKDSLYTYVSVSKYSYDTPDTNNFDDRDELRINSRVNAMHKFNPEFEIELQASVNLYHMVYIFGERSADNNWNRIFTLRPMLYYHPGERFQWRQSFEVLANYVDYDFDDLNLLTKSFVFRKFSVEDSLQYNFTTRSNLQLDYRLQMEENGQLSWDQWTERVLVSRTKQSLRVLYGYRPQPYFRINSGYTYYVREEWKHNTNAFGVEEKTKAGVYTSQGPIVRFIYAPSQKTQFILDAIRYKVNAPDQPEYYINNIELKLNWIF